MDIVAQLQAYSNSATTYRKLRVNIVLSIRCLTNKDRPRNSGAWLHLFYINTFYICEMIICFHSVTPKTGWRQQDVYLWTPHSQQTLLSVPDDNRFIMAIAHLLLKRRNDCQREVMAGVVLCGGFTRDSLALMWQRGIGEGIVRRRRGIFFCCCFDRLSYFRLCFSIREANKNKCVSLYYIHRHTENHPEQTVDISHHVCHNVARQIVGIKRSQSVRRQIRTEKSVAMRVINKDRWIKQVREMLALNKQQQNKIGTKGPDQLIFGCLKTFRVAIANVQLPKSTLCQHKILPRTFH